jgi:heat shock protein HslJ
MDRDPAVEPMRLVGALLLLIVAGCGPYHGTAPSRAASPTPSAGLVGTRWTLEDLGGAGVVEEASATLEFPEPGKVTGSGSCNRFFGTVSINGDAIAIGPLGSARMACTEAVAMQEVNYLRALQSAERYVLQGVALLIYVRGMQSPLRFIPGG